MRKRLTVIGKSLGFIIDKPILELLGLDKDTEFRLTTEGGKLIFEPISKSREERFREASARVLERHGETFRKLAEYDATAEKESA